MRAFLFLPVLSILVLVSCGGPRRPAPKKVSTVDPTNGSTVVAPPLVVPDKPAMPVATLPTRRDPVLLPGDMLQISVYKQPDLSLQVRVPQEGVFQYPLIGEVKAAGKTQAALEREIRDKLAKDYLHNPFVTVTVTAFATRQVYILGGIQKPDRYKLQPTERLTVLQLISAAGGFTDRAYKQKVQIVRRNGDGLREVIILSLIEVEKAIARGHGEADIELFPDDLVVIPSGARVVYVLGAVKLPGWFDIPTDTRMTVSMAISRAGSYTKFAATGKIQVLRQKGTGKSEKIMVDLDEIVNGRLDLDIDLEPGDVVWVPERGIF